MQIEYKRYILRWSGEDVEVLLGETLLAITLDLDSAKEFCDYHSEKETACNSNTNDI